MNVNEKISALRELMIQNNLNWYLIPTDDYHMSEYVGDYFKERAYMSGFNGSAGVLLVGLEEAYLWTDGRYFLQAESDLKSTCIKLMKMGMPGVPTFIDFIKVQDKVRLGLDARCISSNIGNNLASAKNVKIKGNIDLVNKIWSDRPSLSCEPVYLLDIKYTGKDASEKIADFREEMAKNNVNYALISSLDDIAWLLNIRGNDIMCNPVVLSHLIITDNNVTIYVQKKALNNEVKEYLAKENIDIKNYNDFYLDVSKIKNQNIVVDLNKINYRTYSSIDESNYVLNKMNFSTMPKAMKNPIEVKNMKKAHIKDGVAVIKFITYMKKNAGKVKMSELSCLNTLENFRKEGKNYLGPSFDMIVGFGPHGAIIHYEPNEDTDVEIGMNNLLLVDSGGQYLEGTTDITRTIVIGKVTPQMKKDFTLVLKGYLALSDVIFNEGASGAALDIMARRPLWNEGLDYRHGTGHGVGYLLNVHEGPQSIHYGRITAPLKEGMITSDEPGLYKENEYGIRHESLVLTKLYKETEYGRFLRFEPITMVPFDRDAIDVKMLTDEELNKLNAYHKKVFNSVYRYLPHDAQKYLVKACAPIKR